MRVMIEEDAEPIDRRLLDDYCVARCIRKLEFIGENEVSLIATLQKLKEGAQYGYIIMIQMS